MRGTTDRRVGRQEGTGMAGPDGDESQDELLGPARALRRLADGRPELAARVDRLIERIAAGRFHVTVLGDFKRGKSTLVNAIVGRALLPSGVVPLTAVATEIHFGTARTEVVFLDGRREAVPAEDLAAYVTERDNPANAKGVARVEVGIPGVLGAPGVVLVDTPGAGSANEHNSEAAYAALAESDAAVLVLSADSPVSDSEQAIMAQLAERGCKVFVVVNRSDHLRPEELDEVEAFVAARLGEHLDVWSGPYRTDARAALQSCLGGAAAPSGPAAGLASAGNGPPPPGFDAFRRELERFVRSDLAGARRAAAVAELGRLARQLEQALQLESAAGSMGTAALESKLARFRQAADDGRRLLDEDRIVLEHDASDLVERAGARLAADAADAARSSAPALEPTARQASRRTLAFDLRDEVERCVRTGFEPVRHAVERSLDAEWAAVAERFTARVQERVTGLVSAAEQLFDVHLPVVTVPPVEAQSQRFSYQFVVVESPTAPVGRTLATWLLPQEVVRRRALRAGQRRLAEELSKHAGRARYDVSQRVEAARRELVAAMVSEYEETERSLVQAVEGARSLLERSGEEGARREHQLADVCALVDTVERLGAKASPVVP